MVDAVNAEQEEDDEEEEEEEGHQKEGEDAKQTTRRSWRLSRTPPLTHTTSPATQMPAHKEAGGADEGRAVKW